MTRRTRLLAALLCAGGMWSASAAQAQQCASDADCSEGFGCTLSREVTCTGGGCATTGTGAGGAAGDQAGGAGRVGAPETGGFGGAAPCDYEQPDCRIENWGYCERKGCASDSDCLAGTVCREESLFLCTYADPCPELASCPIDSDALEQTCAETTRNTCQPRSWFPCTDDAECGEGYACTAESQICTCTAPASSPIAGAGGGGEPLGGGAGGAECSCEPAFYCTLQERACATDDDCPAHFSCGSNPCAGCYEGAGGVSGGFAGGEAPECEPLPGVAPRVCRPPAYLDGYFDCGGAGGAGGSSGSAGGFGGTWEPPNNGAAGYIGAAGRTGGSAGLGSGAAGASSGAGGAGSANPQGPSSGSSGHDHSRWARLLGCSTVRVDGGSGGAGFVAFGLLLLGLRGRSRRVARTPR